MIFKDLCVIMIKNCLEYIMNVENLFLNLSDTKHQPRYF